MGVLSTHRVEVIQRAHRVSGLKTEPLLLAFESHNISRHLILSESEIDPKLSDGSVDDLAMSPTRIITNQLRRFRQFFWTMGIQFS
jgi:hypothetical protein